MFSMSRRRLLIGGVAAVAAAAAGPGMALRRASGAVTEWAASGPLQHVYDPTPPGGPAKYMNDHTFIKGRDGTWHLYGIVNDAVPPPQAPDGSKEINFAHATAPSLTGPWTTHPYALTVDTNYYGEQHLWAPHVIENAGTYYMFYAAGGTTTSAMNLATSTDLYNWTRIPSGPLFYGNAARDPYVANVNGQWVMYYCEDTGSNGHHVVAYRTSTDLLNWSGMSIAYTDPSNDVFPSVTESPTVVQRNGTWYLFIGPCRGYVGTDVYRSQNPLSFAVSDYAGHIPSHAAEVIQDGTNWWVSGAGVFEHGIYLAPLSWQSTPPVWPSAQNPAVILDGTGRIQVFLLSPVDHSILRRVQTDPANNVWSNWQKFGAPAGAAPTLGQNADGRLEIFSIAPDGSSLLHCYQTSATADTWAAWETFGTAAGAAPTVGRNLDGRLEVFALGPAGTYIEHRWQNQPNGGWSNWEHFGNAAGAPPVVANNRDGRMEVFVLGPSGGYVSHVWQNVPNGGWSNWETIGGPAGNTPTMALGVDGKLTVFALSPVGVGVQQLVQTAPNSGWAGWQNFSSFADTPPTIVQNADGRLEAIETMPGGDYTSHRWQNPDGSWYGTATTGWQSFGAAPVACTPSAVRAADGRIHVFAISADGTTLSELVQVQPSGGWGTWSSVPIG